MSMYYRRLDDQEEGKNGDIALTNPSGLIALLRPVEVDDWHPASHPPTKEDFEPTGQVLCLTKFESGKVHPWFGTPKNQLADADYWCKISVPK